MHCNAGYVLPSTGFIAINFVKADVAVFLLIISAKEISYDIVTHFDFCICLSTI